MTNDFSTPESIAAAMSELGMKQAQFASELGVNQATVSRWVNDNAKPSWAVRQMIARLLDEKAKQTTEAAE